MHIYIIYAHTHAKDYTEKDIREVATMYLLDGSHSWLVFFNYLCLVLYVAVAQFATGNQKWKASANISLVQIYDS